MEYISPRKKLQYLITEFCNTYALTPEQAIKTMRQELQSKKGTSYNDLKDGEKELITLTIERS